MKPPAAFPLDWSHKSAPFAAPPPMSDQIGGLGLNILREDVPFPVAVLKDAALSHNSGWMRRFLALSGAKICPHGKTSMSPELFALQLRDGAWGVTAATAAHVRVYRRFGIGRILLANQLVGRSNIAFVLDELRRDPAFDFYCLVDSTASAAFLDAALVAHPIGRPLQVLLEVGMAGGRTGARDADAALEVARAVAGSRNLALRGVEAFEGVAQGLPPDQGEARMSELVERVAAVASQCAALGLFAPGEVILTAGGSAFFDRVDEILSAARLDRPFQVVLRSGCYLSHDSGFYDRLVRRMVERSPRIQALGPGLQAALEVWACVHARPETGRVIAGFGKRDAGADIEPPTPLKWARPGFPPAGLSGCRVSRLDDQHAYLDVPGDCPLQVGDLIGFGVSHPCTTFDRWRSLFRVDEAYGVTGVVRTVF